MKHLMSSSHFIGILKTWIKAVLRTVNNIGNQRQCNICGETFFRFTKYRNGSAGIPPARRLLDIVGSDVDNFGCLNCRSHDRERHLFMYFDKLGLWEKVVGGSVLHFAPEINLSSKISRLQPSRYVMADLHPTNDQIMKVDATRIPFEEDQMDFLIANHILEHIPDHTKALDEFFRVLKPGGIAILQTPFSKRLKENFDDEGLDTDDVRLFFHGQEDHVRTFSERALHRSIEEAGFSLSIQKHNDLFKERDAHRFGVPENEDLIMAIKPLKAD